MTKRTTVTDGCKIVTKFRTPDTTGFKEFDWRYGSSGNTSLGKFMLCETQIKGTDLPRFHLNRFPYFTLTARAVITKYASISQATPAPRTRLFQ